MSQSIQDSTPLRLSGIVPPLVTPLLDGDQLDIDGTQRLLEYVLSSSVAGLFILGSTGEAPSLSYRLRREFVSLVAKVVKRRVPVLVGITDTAFVESMALAEHAAACDVDAVVLTTPYYFPAGQTELITYVNEVVRHCPLPLMLYNMPGLTKVWFEPSTLEKLAEHQSIIGVKDSSGELDYFGEIVRLKQRRPDWSILMGPEHLLVDAMRLGGDGGVNGGANVFPHLFTACYDAAVAGQMERVSVLRGMIDELQQIYDVGKYASRFIKATKSAVSLLNLCSDRLALPFNHFLEPERDRVAEIIWPIRDRLRTLSLFDG